MIPVFDVGRPIQWAKDIIINFTKWIALKLLLVTLCVTVLPVSLYVGWKLILKQIMTFVFNSAGTENHAAMVQFTGLAAWLGDHLRFQESFLILSSALMVRFVLGFFKK